MKPRSPFTRPAPSIAKTFGRIIALAPRRGDEERSAAVADFSGEAVVVQYRNPPQESAGNSIVLSPRIGDLVSLDSSPAEVAASHLSRGNATLPSVSLLHAGPGHLPGGGSDYALMRSNGTLRNLRLRALLLRDLRIFFQEQDFTEVETPVLVHCPGVETHLPAIPCSTVGGTRHLTTSPEFHMKRLMVAGMDKVYQLTRSFRDGERGKLHNPEFSILEWYRANASYEAIMDDLERLLVSLAVKAHQSTPAPSGNPEEPSGVAPAEGAADEEESSAPGELITYDGLPISLKTPFPRITVRQAFREFAGLDLHSLLSPSGHAATESPGGARLEAYPPLVSADAEEKFFRAMIDVVEPALKEMGRPVFLTEWPAPMASLGKIRGAGDPCLTGEGGACASSLVAERFELYAGGLELANGFSEVNSATEMRQRMEEDVERRRRDGLPVYPVDDLYLQALEIGLPPCAGVAVGMDRLVMLLVDAQSIDQVIAFPFERA